MTNQDFIHCEDNNTHLTLHDCIAEKVYLRDGKLIFEFPDGFEILPEHPDNPYNKLMVTDAAKVEFTLIDDYKSVCGVQARVFVQEREKNRKRTVKCWDADLFIKTINSRKCAYEFIYHYLDTQNPSNNLIYGYLHGEGKYSFCECWLEIYAKKVNYYWNNIIPY